MAREQKSPEGALKRAHRAASTRLAEEYPIEYAVFMMQSNNVVYIAQSELRMHFPDKFKALYEEEKKKAGIIQSGRHPWRDRAALAEEAVRLYDNGNGPSIRKIAATLHVDYSFARESILAAGIVPKIGRRKKSAPQEDAGTHHEGTAAYDQGGKGRSPEGMA